MSLNQVIEEHKVSSINEFIDKLPNKQSFAVKTVYRGHRSHKWELIPSLFQLPYLPTNVMGSWRRLEELLLEQFQKQSMPFLRSIPQDTLEWLALSQHHGLPTRLLDWTESPLVALFFAVNDPPFSQEVDEDAVVWCIHAFAPQVSFFKSLEELNLMLEARKTNKNILYFPYHTTPRMSAQQGCFTIHLPPLSSEENFMPLEVQFTMGDKSILPTKYIIPAEKRLTICKELDTIGINYFTLFPDLDGLSRKLIQDIFYAETWLMKDE